MDWTQVALWILLGVALACVAGALILAGLHDLEQVRRRTRIRTEQYRAEAELQHLTQRAMTQMLQAVRMDARLRAAQQPKPNSGTVAPSADDIVGESWDPHD